MLVSYDSVIIQYRSLNTMWSDISHYDRHDPAVEAWCAMFASYDIIRPDTTRHPTVYSIWKSVKFICNISTIHKLTSSKKTWWQSVIEIYDLFIKNIYFYFHVTRFEGRLSWAGDLQLVFLKPKIHLVFFKGCFGARVEVKLIRKRAEGVTAVSWD